MLLFHCLQLSSTVGTQRTILKILNSEGVQFSHAKLHSELPTLLWWHHHWGKLSLTVPLSSLHQKKPTLCHASLKFKHIVAMCFFCFWSIMYTFWGFKTCRAQWEFGSFWFGSYIYRKVQIFTQKVFVTSFIKDPLHIYIYICIYDYSMSVDFKISYRGKKNRSERSPSLVRSKCSSPASVEGVEVFE